MAERAGAASARERSLAGKRELFCVELPGRLRNGPEAAVEALGGWDVLSTVIANAEGSLNLRLREGHGGQVESSPPQVVSNLLCDGSGEVVGTVSQTVRFDALCDFTYVDRGARDLVGLSERVLDPTAEDLAAVRPSKLSRYREPRLDQGFRGMFMVYQEEPKQSKQTFAKYTDQEVPSSADPGRGVKQATLTALRQLFDERPMWTRSRLTHELTETPAKDLVLALRVVAYRFVGSGPFRYVWIRMGLDPRQDPEMRIYQSIEMNYHPLGTVAGAWGQKFLVPRKLVARGEEESARRGRVHFQMYDVKEITDVQNALAAAKLRPQLVVDRVGLQQRTKAQCGFFEPESFEAVVSAVREALMRSLDGAGDPPPRRRRPMMDRMRSITREHDPAVAPTPGPSLEDELERHNRSTATHQGWDRGPGRGSASPALAAEDAAGAEAVELEAGAEIEPAQSAEEAQVADDDDHFDINDDSDSD